MDEVVYEWFCTARCKNAPISGSLIQEKVLEAARALNFADDLKPEMAGFTN
jgi:hypothetical protein